LNSSIVFEKYPCEDTRTTITNPNSASTLFVLLSRKREQPRNVYRSISNVSFNEKPRAKKEEEVQ
jgi:hypothetical protein